MSAISATTVYTWATPHGNLNLLEEENGYTLSLKKNDQAETLIPLTKDQQALFSRAEQIQTTCDSYFPLLALNAQRQLNVAFHPIASPGAPTGAQQPKSFAFSFNTMENKRLLNFSREAPFYRRVIRGLNMQGECVNAICAAYGRTVYMPQGLGVFNIARLKNTSSCPACLTQIPSAKVNNLGFWDCNYKIEGEHAEGNNPFFQEELAVSEEFTTFTPDENCAWQYLDVTTTAAPAPAAQPQATGICAIL